MSVPNPAEEDTLRGRLAKQIETNREGLIEIYRQTLNQTLFTNRSAVHPRMLQEIAVGEVQSLFDFLTQPTFSGQAHGEHLAEIGVSAQTLARLGRSTRQFFIARLEKDVLGQALEITDEYEEAVTRGFISSRERVILAEQEQIRSALQVAVSRFTVEIKQVQEMAKKATEASEFKSRLLARVSHELRTPLGALMGMTEMLQENVYGSLNPEQQKIAQRIINSAVALKKVFTEILDQSQIESGEVRLKVDEFSPRVLAETVHSGLLSLAVQKGLTLSVDIDPGAPTVVVGDKTRVEQVLSHLIMNAIKFTQTGGVTVHIHKVENGRWTFQVKDSGIGISKDAQAYIFEPFRQVDETTSREFGGVGLGLSIAYRLVASMEGTLGVESKIGQGTVFTVSLPVRPTRTDSRG